MCQNCMGLAAEISGKMQLYGDCWIYERQLREEDLSMQFSTRQKTVV
jgi:hypothetical protein